MSRRTVILFVLVLIALAGWFLIELPQRRDEGRHADESARLVSFDPTKLDGVVVRRRDATLAFSIVGAHWEMTRPVADLGETASIASLLDALERASVARDLGAGEELVRYGLAAPVLRIRLVAGTDTLASVDLGDYTVDRASVYALRADGSIVLAPTDIMRLASLPVDDYRNRRVIPFDRERASGFTLVTRDEESTWTRGTRDNWFTVVAGDTIEGDSIAVEGVLRTLHGLRVTRILAPSDTAGVMNDPDVIVVLRRPQGPADAVRFRCPDHAACLARRDGETRVVSVDHDLLNLREAGVATLRDRRVLHFEPEQAARIEIVTPDTSAVLVRAGDTWALPNPAMGRIDPRLASDLVRTLRGLRWIARDDDPAPAGKARFSVIIKAPDGRTLDEFHATVTGDGASGRRPSLAFRVHVGRGAIDDLTARLRRMRASG